MSQRKQIFGVDHIIAIDPDTNIPYGEAKVLSALSFNFSGEVIENMGGASPYPYGVEDGDISPEMTMTFKEYPNFLWTAFNGVTPTENSAEASGAVSSALANKKGGSVFDATTGIASVTVKSGSEADLASGKYVIVAADATTVNVHALGDLDFGRGTAKLYIDETLKINASPLTVVSGDSTDIDNFGLEINGGSGTIGMTAGDTAVFEVRSANAGSDVVKVGSNTSEYKEVGLICSAQRRSDGELFTIEVFRAKAIGMPISLTRKEFSETEITAKLFRDEAEDAVYKMTRIQR